MDISSVELQLDDSTTVYAVWDDSSGDYWYSDEKGDDDDDGTVNAVTTADDCHWEWDDENNCWWFYDHTADKWTWCWDKPEPTTTTTVNWVWDEATQTYWAENATAAANSQVTETPVTTTIGSVTPLEAEWTIQHVGVLNWDELDDDVQVSLEDTEDEDHVALDHCYDFDYLPFDSTCIDRNYAAKPSTFDLGLADPAFSILDCITSPSSSSNCVSQDRSGDATSSDFTAKCIY